MSYDRLKLTQSTFNDLLDELLGQFVSPFIAHLILEIEGDQKIKGFDTTGYE